MALTVLLAAVLSFSGVLRVLEVYVVEVLQRRVFIGVEPDFGRRIPSLQGELFESLGLEPDQKDIVLDFLFAANLPWTVVVVTENHAPADA